MERADLGICARPGKAFILEGVEGEGWPVPGAGRRYGCSPWWRRCSCHPAGPPWCCRRWWWAQTGCWCCLRRLEASKGQRESQNWRLIRTGYRKSAKKKAGAALVSLRLLLTPWPSSWDAPYCSWTCCWYSGSVQWKRTSALSLAISKHFIWTADALLPRFTVVSCLLQRLHAHYAGEERDKEQTTNYADVWV